jgi:hypothetical protein
VGRTGEGRNEVLEVNLRGEYDALLGMVAHDAKTAEGVMLELLAYISLVCGSDASRWKLHQSQPGASSFSLHGPGQRQYHFRANTTGLGGLRVYDRPSSGRLVTTIQTRGEARDFVKSVLEG